MPDQSSTAITNTACDSSALVWINGQLLGAHQATVSVLDHGLLYGDGVFEGIRIYAGRIFKLKSHLQRLYESAQAIRLTIPYSLQQLEEATHHVVAANKRRDGYIRLCVTRGPGNLGVSPKSCHQPQVIIIVDGIELYPPQVYEQGLEVIIATTMRNHPASLSPRIKSMNYLNNILAKLEAIDAGVLEAVMLNHLGFVTECTGDNIFIVADHQHKPALFTPPSHAGILEGVTRNTIMSLADQLGYHAIQADLTREDLYTAQEIFLTGTAAEVVAVTKVDNKTIGQGKRGPVTTALAEAFNKLTKHNAPED